jgi:hypothetical protein
MCWLHQTSKKSLYCDCEVCNNNYFHLHKVFYFLKLAKLWLHWLLFLSPVVALVCVLTSHLSCKQCNISLERIRTTRRETRYQMITMMTAHLCDRRQKPQNSVNFAYLLIQSWDFSHAVNIIRWLSKNTCSGNVVSCRSASFSAYTRIVFKDRRKDSSLNDELVPTRELSDIVTCIFTLAKFWNGITNIMYYDTTLLKYTTDRIIKL